MHYNIFDEDYSHSLLHTNRTQWKTNKQTEWQTDTIKTK